MTDETAAAKRAQPSGPSSVEKALGAAAPWAPALSLFAIASLLGLGLSWIFPKHRVLFDQAGAAFFLLGLWAGALGRRQTSGEAAIPVIFAWHRGIWTQPTAQSIILFYWSFYYPEVGGRSLTFLLQLFFGLATDMLSNWRSRGRLQGSASVIPIVLSINLFLWHDDLHLWESLAIVAVAVLSKSLWRWKDPRYGHIFNPSAIALSLAGVIYYCFLNYQSWTFIRLDESLILPPNTSEIVLGAALLVQLGFGTAPTTLAGIIAMLAWGLTLRSLGIHYIPYPFEAQNFIGLTLLMTDPMTSPRTLFGRALFGGIWGTLFVGIQVLLAYTLGTSYVYFGKIFAVPLANLTAPWLDRYARRQTDGRSLPAAAPAARAWWYAAAAAIPLVFAAGWSSAAKREGFEDSRRAEFKLMHAPEIQKTAQDGRRVLCADNPVYCRPFSFKGELELWLAPGRTGRPAPSTPPH